VGENAALKGIKFKRDATKWNMDRKIVDKVFQDKLQFGRLKHPSIAPTKSLATVRGTKAMDDAELAHLLAKKRKDVYIKPRKEYASGAGGHISSRDIREELKQGKTPAIVHKLRYEPEKYVVQPHLDFDYGKEQRIHIAVQNGKARPIGMRQSRYGLFTSMGKDVPTGPEAAKAFNETVKRNPRLAKQLKGKNMVLGGDIAKDSKGQLKQIEWNDQSGFQYYPEVGHGIYRAVTGADSRVVAGAKGLAIGAVTVGTGAAISRRGKKNGPSN
jgi:hypothetical protein